MKHKIIYGMLALAVLGLLMLSGCSTCSKLNKHITTGTAFNNGKCCSGLSAKAPDGFTGGVWCVHPYCDVVCLTGLEEIQGVTVKGIYSVCHSQTDTSVTLLIDGHCR